jgi:hypothetical protein
MKPIHTRKHDVQHDCIEEHRPGLLKTLESVRRNFDRVPLTRQTAMEQVGHPGIVLNY